MKIFYVAIIMLAMGGCAAHHPATSQYVKAVPASKVQPQAPDVIEVESSLGKVSIEPTVVGYSEPDYHDPLEGLNRLMFDFNHGAYTYVFIPLARGYRAVTPQPLRDGIANVFANLREPLNLLSHLLVGQVAAAINAGGRFVLNSTVGIAGLFDPAAAWFELTPAPRQLNDSLRDHDVGYGAYLVLPLLGPSDLRSGASSLIEGVIHPLGYVTDSPQTAYWRIFQGLHEFSGQADNYPPLYKKSDDPYLFFRNLHLQQSLRDKQFSQAAKH